MVNFLRLPQLGMIVFFVFAHTISCKSDPKTSPRIKYNFDFNWKFKLGNDSRASQINFSDEDWRILNVPHDWSIEGNYDKNNPSGPEGAFLPTGIGWYRKTFKWLPDWENKKVSIQFEGIYHNSTVWINGVKLGNRPNGYIGFSYDLTPYLKKGDNIVAVKVDNSKSPSGRWYTGCGIYRHVNLLVTAKVYVPNEGLLISTPKVDHRLAQIATHLQVNNETPNIKNVEVVFNVTDKSGRVVSKSQKSIVLNKGKNKVESFIELNKPALWSTEHPNLYRMQIQIKDDSQIFDVFESNFGVRSISFSAVSGFQLNGVKTILKGVCNHHDAGAVGSAVPYDVWYYRLKMLKEMGCNAIRTAHTPFAPEFYDLCDKMGFLVMDEAFDGWEEPKAEYDYGIYFNDWWRKDLASFIKRDFNHPSVIIWSIGNEVKDYTAAMQRTMVDFVKDIDNSRPITQGRGYMGSSIDLAGFNGGGEFKGALEEFHSKHPNKPIVGTEMTHGLQTRGVYRTLTKYRMRDYPAPWEQNQQFSSIKSKVFWQDDLTKNEVFQGINPFYHSSYDNDLIRMSIRDYWKATKDLPYYLGGFRWTGFDYLGESFGWPARTMNYGVIDLAGFPTDSYYLYQSLWTEKPMIHLLPNWTLPVKEGEVIPVIAYTNADSAELFLNGVSLGEKPMTDEYRIVWDVPYKPGELKVIARKKGRTVATDSQITAGNAYAISVKSTPKAMRANQTDVTNLEITVVDENGIEVPQANNRINIEISGPGKLIGLENGDILDLSSSKSNHKQLFKGKCLAIIQATDQTGNVKINISAEGLVNKELIIPVKQVDQEIKSL